MIIDPYGNRDGCTCNNTKGLFAAALLGEPRPLCEVHDGAAIRQRADDVRAEALGKAFAELKISLAEVRGTGPAGPPCTCRSLRDGLGAALRGDPVAACVLHAPGGDPNSSDHTPLNTTALPARLAQLLRAEPDSDPPTAA